MSGISFIHLSDIHFRKTSGNASDIDQALREAIIHDINYNAKDNLKSIKGILAGGDIAFAGQAEEYDKARTFLGELTDSLGIEREAVYCVPGNHDVDQNIPRESRSVYSAQKEIENATDIDIADKILEQQMLDPAGRDLLFTPIQNYNDFAALFSCNINSKHPLWHKYFKLNEGMQLYLVGMNSCLISSADDHAKPKTLRPMVVGQGQIPAYKENTVCMVLCHHPIEHWKFRGLIQERIDKRADIQLYGHKHIQSIEENADRLVLGAGATHPVRGEDWNPRYNWLNIDCFKINNERIVSVKVYPRILSSDRDRFIADPEIELTNMYYEFRIDIDAKRRRNLSDLCSEMKSNSIKMMSLETNIPEQMEDIDIRRITYDFFALPYIRQTEILAELSLLNENNKGKRYIEIFDEIISNVLASGRLIELSKLISIKTND